MTVTKNLVTEDASEPEFVQLQLQSIISEYLTAQARSSADEQTAAQQTGMFMTTLDHTVAGLSESGKVILVHEAVIAGDIPDVTESVKAAVYAKVPRPQIAQAPGAGEPSEAARVQGRECRPLWHPMREAKAMARAKTGWPKTKRLSTKGKLLAVAALLGVFGAVSALDEWSQNHALMINATNLLPNWAFLVESGGFPKRGDYVIFHPGYDPVTKNYFGDEPRLSRRSRSAYPEMS